MNLKIAKSYSLIFGRPKHAPLLENFAGKFCWREVDDHFLGATTAPAGETTDRSLKVAYMFLISIVHVNSKPFVRAAKCSRINFIRFLNLLADSGPFGDQ